MASMGGEGFDEFVDAELPGLLRLGHLLTGSPHDAWDLTQDALVRVGLAWSRIDANGNSAGYAQRTMARLHVSRWRRLRREVLGGSAEGPTIPDRAADAELAATLRTALQQLGRQQRTAVVLRYYCDLPLQDIADYMGCSVGGAKSQLSRGTSRLRDFLSTDPRIESRVKEGR